MEVAGIDFYLSVSVCSLHINKRGGQKNHSTQIKNTKDRV